MFLDKRGDFKYGTLAKIILVLIIGIIMIYGTYLITAGSKRGADIASCKAWTVFQSSVKDPALGVPLTEFKNPCITFKDTLEGGDTEIYEILANNMHDTWKMYGEGKVDFFTDRGLGSTSCFIGSEIKISDEIKTDSINIDDFEQWLSHNFPPNADYTYSEYFLGTPDATIDLGFKQIELNKNSKIYSVFIIEKMSPKDLSGQLKVAGKGLYKTGLALLTISSKSTFTKAGAKLGLIGLVVGTFAYVASDQSIMIPSVALLKGDEIIEENCDSIHYNPETNILEKTFGGFSGGEFGGGGAGRNVE